MDWRQIAQATVWPDGVVVELPFGQDHSGMGERAEQRLVQQLVTQTAIEALDKGVLLRFARRDVVPFDTALLRPAQDRRAGQLGAVVGDTGGGFTAFGNYRIEFAPDPQPGQRGIGDQRQALAGEIVDDGEDAKAPAILSWSCRKSIDQRWFGPCGRVSGARVPSARLRPPRRRT
jgi:hypothetical protein